MSILQSGDIISDTIILNKDFPVPMVAGTSILDKTQPQMIIGYKEARMMIKE